MTKFTSYVSEPPGHAVEDVVRNLNADDSEWRFPQARKNLVALIDAWRQAQIAPYDRREKEIGGQKPILLKMEWPPGCPSWKEVAKDLRNYPAAAGAGFYSVTHYSPGRAWTAWDLALSFFTRLLQDPQCEKIGGPCPRPGCGKYFIRAGKKEKRYCSRDCASIDGALQATKRDRDDKQKAKLKLAKEAISKYNSGRTSKDWKTWTVDYGRELEISQKWLTRAVNAGKLQPPEGDIHAKS